VNIELNTGKNNTKLCRTNIWSCTWWKWQLSRLFCSSTRWR